MAFNKAKALQEAEKSLAHGKTSQAIRLYLDIYAKDPGDAAGAYRESAEIAFRKGDLGAAEVALAKASALAPQDSKTLVLRARLALGKNQPAEAEKILTSSLSIKSDPAAQKLLLESYLG